MLQENTEMCYKDKVSNKIVGEKLERHFTIMDMIKKRKRKLFEHLCRIKDERLMKAVMLGMIKGVQPRARPARRRSDGPE